LYCSRIFTSELKARWKRVSPVLKREVGGLGIFLTKKIVDDINYRYENNKNILTILKK